jgi:hypothetical protein
MKLCCRICFSNAGGEESEVRSRVATSKTRNYWEQIRLVQISGNNSPVPAGYSAVSTFLYA